MNGKHLVYRALMPDHYLPLVTNDKQQTSLDGSRKWVATKLPNLRVFGPLWSFGLVVADLQQSNLFPPPGHLAGARLFDLRSLSAGPGVENKPLLRQHPPRLFQARVASCLQVELPNTEEPANVSESRISTVALDTVPPNRVDNEGHITSAIQPGWLAVGHGDKPVGQPPTVLLMPFGDPFAAPDKAAEGKTLRSQFLPAMRLVHGRIRLESSPAFLRTARQHLRLDPPQVASGDKAELVLLDDGFALRGRVTLPWHDTPVEGWFRVGLEAEGTEARPVMVPWFDDDFPETARQQRFDWDAALNRLADVLAAARRAERAPAWLDLRVSDRIAAEDVVFPLEFRSGTVDAQSLNAPIMVHRPKAVTAVEIVGAALVLRLADRAQSRQPRASLTVTPRRFVVSKATQGLKIAAEITGSEKSRNTTAAVAEYAYDDRSERLALRGETEQAPLQLAVPIVETAAMLRTAMQMPAPQKDDDAGPWLWGFSPIDSGWLHWPIPNLTPQAIEDLLPDGTQSAPFTQNDPADGISGAVLFGNLAGAPDYRPDHRTWSLSVAEPRKVTVEALIEMPAGNPPGIRFVSATARLFNPAIALDGVFPVVPFRQTDERLLPDHAERALAGRTLPAISPRMLPPREAAAWAAGVAQMALTVEELSVRPDVKGNLIEAKAMTLATQVADSKAPSPWIWTRHSTLPALQTMPQAVAGAAVSAPSQARSLAPLRHVGQPSAYRLGLDPARTDLVPDRTAGTFAGTFERLPGMGGLAELGMSVTTLPSATLFPALAEGQGFAGSLWNDYAAARLHLRHDIALADEANAMAVPPPPETPPPSEVESETAPRLRFAPRPDNGPGPEGEVAAKVWASLDRKLALAALDHRDMAVGPDAAQATLAGFGPGPSPVGALALDPKVSLDAEQVQSIGRWTWTPADNSTTLGGEGLPLGGDHAGLSGQVPTSGGTVEVDLGTAILSEAAGAFADQTGLRHDGIRDVANGGRLHEVDNRGTRVRLLTFADPVPVNGQGKLAFWCSDLPVRIDGEADTLGALVQTDEAGAGDLRRANGASVELNLLTGFRWALGVPGVAADVVDIDGLRFAPLALVDAMIDADGNLASVRIEGRLVLPLATGDVPETPGRATLTLTAADQGFAASLTATGVIWPLAPVTAQDPAAPRLHIPDLPGPGAEATASLAVTMGGVRQDIDLTLRRRAAGDTTGPVLTAGLAVNSVAAASGRLVVTRLDLSIAAAPGTHKAEVELAFRVKDGDLDLSGAISRDLLVNDPEFRPVAGAWTLRAHGKPLATALTSPGEGAVRLGDGVLALSMPAGPVQDSASLIDPLVPQSGSFWLLAGLTPDAPAPVQGSRPPPVFRITGLRLGARLRCHLPGQAELTLATGDPSGTGGTLRLYGTLTGQNAFSWPMLAVDANTAGFERATVPANAQTAITHEVAVRLDGARLETQDGCLVVAASVRHRLNAPDNRSVSWHSYQHVRLWTAEAFKAALEQRKTASSAPKKKPLDKPTAFSPIGEQGPKDWSDMTAVPHFLHVSAANPAGFAGELADKMITAAGSARFLALDVSGHHALFPPTGGKGFLLSLPGTVFLGADAPAVLADENVAPMLATRPPADTNAALHVIDGREGRTLTSLSRTQRNGLVQAAGAARQRASRQGIGLTEAALGAAVASEDVFQAVPLVENSKEVWRTAGQWPGLGTAFQLARFLESGMPEDGLVACRLATPPYLTSADIHGGNPAGPTAVDRDRMVRMTEQLRARALQVLLLGPDGGTDDAVPSPQGQPRLRLFAPAAGGGAPRLLADVDLRQAADKTQDLDTEWARANLRRLAPDAAFGLIEDTRSGGSVIDQTRGPQVRAMGQPLQLRAEGGGTLQVRQRQAMQATVPLPAGLANPPALAARLRDGFRTSHVRPMWLHSGATDEAGPPDDPQLASSALVVSMRLADVPTAVLAAGDQARFWMTDSQTVAFRPQVAFTQGAPATHALAKGYAARLPAPLVPVRPNDVPAGLAASDLPPPAQPDSAGSGDDAPSNVIETYQSFLPAHHVTSVIAGRPGALVIRRTTIAVNGGTGWTAGHLALSAAMPLHARLPRLPRLGQADRVRASAVEPGMPWLKDRASVILYGPAAEPEVGSPDTAAPEHALRLVLDAPRDAVLTAAWDGRVELSVDAVFGTDSAGPWTLDDVRLTTDGGQDLLAGSVFAATLEARPGASIRLDLSPARLAVAALPAALPLRLTLGLKQGSDQTEDSRQLRRQVVFDFLTGGAEGPTAGPEKAIFLRFEDPEYDEALAGVPRTVRETSPYDSDDELVLAAEMSSARVDQRLAFAVALREEATGHSPNTPFPAAALLLRFERQRPGQLTADVMKLEPEQGSGLEAFDPATRCHALAAYGPADAVFFLELGRLQTVDGTGVLAPADRLVVAVMQAAADGALAVVARIEVNIVTMPQLPANGSGYALLALSRGTDGGGRVQVVLHAARPKAAVIELVDPLDLIRGRLRRRAVYLWRAFLPPEPDRQRDLAVQKIGQTSASWLPDTIGPDGWLGVT